MRGRRGSKPPTRAAASHPRGAGWQRSARGSLSPRRGSHGAQTRAAVPRGAGLKLRGAPPSPQPTLQPRNLSALLRAVPAPTDAAGQGGVGGGVSSRVPMSPLPLTCPAPTALPGSCEGTLATLGFQTPEALSTDVADAQGSESAWGRLRAPHLPGFSRVSAISTSAHAGPPGGVPRSPSSGRPPYLS